MRLNDFIRELTALCKEELNPEIVDDYGSDALSINFEEGKVVITFQSTSWESVDDNDDALGAPVEIDSPILTIVSADADVPDGDDAA